MDQSLINIDNCMVCGVLMNDIRNELTLVMEFCRKPIFLLIEEFTETSFSEEILNEAAVCTDCLVKFEGYDEYQKLSQEIQKEICNLFLTTITTHTEPSEENTSQDEELKIKPEIDDTSNVMVYQDIEEIDHLEEEEVNEFAYIKSCDMVEESDGFVEISEIDRKNLPRKIQMIQKAEKQKVLKTRSIRDENEPLIVVQLENNLKLYQCEICLRAFKERSKLKAHKQIHTTERTIVCPVCSKSFKTPGCLRSHKRVHNPTVIECDFCGKTYTQKPELIKHINVIHFNRRDYVCEYCNAGFGCRGHLKAHYLTHQQYKGVQCSICNFTFHTKAKLDRHMKSHTGQRDFECGICGKRFLYSYNVSAHIRHVHWKEKRKRDDRKNKIKIDHSCHICGHKFGSNFFLRQHLAEAHKFEEVPDMSVTIDDDENIIQYEDEHEVYLESY